MTDHLAVANVLDDAADYIEKNGLYRGPGGVGYAENQGRLCSMMTLAKVAPASPNWSLQLSIDAEDALAKAAGIPACFDIPEWSDSSPNDQFVLDAFRLAAKQQRRLADGLDA